ncbi:MAG: hypothetical protein ACOH2V_12435 [Candidatus Saccharimonadaceae bacterium]
MTKKFSFLILLSSVLFLSSCLDSGENSYIGNKEFSYITQDTKTGTVYARTLAGYFITSEKIGLLTPGSTAFLTYQVTEETEIIPIGDKVNIYKVITGAEPITIDQTILQSSVAPDVPGVYFESLMEPIYASNEFFGDRWMFPYTYKSKKGENVSVKFYKSTTVESNGDIVIDVRLEKMGVAETGASDIIHGDYVSVNMSLLRNLVVVDAGGAKNVNLKFRYYRADKQGSLHTSDKIYSITIQK